MGLYTPISSLLIISSNLIIFSHFSFVLLSLGWIPLSGEFVASYLLVDSLSSELSTYPSIPDLSINLSIVNCGVFIPSTY